MSSKVTVTTEGVTATCVPAVMSDILTTAISTTEAVTGMYGFIQKAGLFVAGMAFHAKRTSGSYNFMAGAQ
jgi:hypothetical protein